MGVIFVCFTASLAGLWVQRTALLRFSARAGSLRFVEPARGNASVQLNASGAASTKTAPCAPAAATAATPCTCSSPTALVATTAPKARPDPAAPTQLPPPTLPDSTPLDPAPPLRLSDGRTLLIIQGSWRSLDRTVGSIIEHLVLPNAPCDVVLSLDRPGPEATLPVFATLQPYLLAIVYPQVSDTREQGMEFAQTTRALQAVDTSKYAFIAKSRTDLMVLQRFAFKAGIGLDSVFPDSFSFFLRGTRSLFPSATPCGVLEAWVRSSGMLHYAAFAHPLDSGAHLRPMPWAPVSSYDMTPALESAVKAACMSGWGGDDDSESRMRGWQFLEKEPTMLRNAVRKIASQSRLFYGQGSTWISWGERDEFIKLHTLMQEAHRFLSWADLPPPGSDWKLRKGFCGGDCTEMNHATESTFRMAHVMRGLSFAELMAPIDVAVSFDNSALLHCIDGLHSSILRDTAASGLPAAFLLRRKHSGCPNQDGLAVRANPFCGSKAESRNSVRITLFCEDGVIDAIPVALYGTPSGTCPEYTADPSCDDAAFPSYVRTTCIGTHHCEIQARQGVDPCPGEQFLFPLFLLACKRAL